MADDLYSFLRETMSDTKRLYLAINNNDENELRILLDKGFDINSSLTEQSNYTALHIACMKGYSSLVIQLLHKGANMNATDYFGATPLTFCLKYASSECLRILLKAGSHVQFVWSAKHSNGVELWTSFSADMLRVAVAATPQLAVDVQNTLGNILSCHNYDKDFLITCLFAGCVVQPDKLTQLRKKHPDLATWLDTEFKRPLSLTYLAILATRKAVRTNCFHAVPYLMLPPRLEHLLLLCHPGM